MNDSTSLSLLLVPFHGFFSVCFMLFLSYFLLFLFLKILFRETEEWIQISGELGRKTEIEGKENTIRIYYVKKKAVFNKRGD